LVGMYSRWLESGLPYRHRLYPPDLLHELKLVRLNHGTAMWNVILGLTTVLGFGLAIWQAMRAEQLNRRQRDLDWPRFRSAASDLARAVDRSGFMPDFILSTSDRGAIVSNLVARELRRQIPIITVGYLDEEDEVSIPGFLTLCGTKATTFLPKGLKGMKDKKVLLLDDFVMSGDGILRVKNQLLEYGFPADCIRSGSVVATKVSIANKKGPDFFAREARDLDFFFPWGRAK
jgi:hypoxanthine phosphoribosyltransferase